MLQNWWCVERCCRGAPVRLAAADATAVRTGRLSPGRHVQHHMVQHAVILHMCFNERRICECCDHAPCRRQDWYHSCRSSHCGCMESRVETSIHYVRFQPCTDFGSGVCFFRCSYMNFFVKHVIAYKVCQYIVNVFSSLTAGVSITELDWVSVSVLYLSDKLNRKEKEGSHHLLFVQVFTYDIISWLS